MPTFTAFIEFSSESNLYVGSVPGVSGAHTQAETLPELLDNLKEVLELIQEEEEIEDLPQFIGVIQIGLPD